MPKFSQFFRSGRFWIVGCMAIVVAACVPFKVQSIGRDLDGIGKALDDYGTVSVSSPLLADVRNMKGEAFQFKLDAGPNEYYRDAKKEVQGVGSLFSQRATDFTGGLRVRANLEDLLTNQIRMNQFNEDEKRYRQRNALQDTGALMGLLIPLIDPKLALADALSDAAAGAAADAMGGGEEGGSGEAGGGGTVQDPEETLDPDQEATLRLQELIKALMATSSGLSGATSRPAIPEFTHNPPDISDDILAENDLVEQLVEDKKFARFRSLLGDMPTSQPAIGNRSAIITAAGDSMVESIMTYLGHPVLDKDWNDKVVLMGVSMVSVAPGTRTQRGYVADVSVRCKLDWRPASTTIVNEMFQSGSQREKDHLELLTTALIAYGAPADIYDRIRDLSEGKFKSDKKEEAMFQAVRTELTNTANSWNNPRNLRLFEIVSTQEGPRLTPVDPRFVAHPVVSAASPMTEAHTFDLASSIRQQQAFAFKLAAIMAGFGAEAEVQTLFKSFDRLEQDLQTRTPMNTVAAYSNAGSTYGYQIGPNLVGIADFVTTRREGGAIGLLGKLIAGEVEPGPDAVLQRQSFPVALFVGLNRRDIGLRLALNVQSGDIRIVEPAIKFEQTTRWIPIKKSRMDDSLTPRPRIHEHDRVEWAWRLADAKKKADMLVSKEGREHYEEFQDYVDSRADTMRSQALVASSYQSLPTELISESFYDDPPVSKVPLVLGHVPGVLPPELLYDSKVPGNPGRKVAYVVLTGRNLSDSTVKSISVEPSGATHGGGAGSVSIRNVVQMNDAILFDLGVETAQVKKDLFFQFKLGYGDEPNEHFILSPAFRIIAEKKSGNTPSTSSTSSADKNNKVLKIVRSIDRNANIETDKLEMDVGSPVDLVREFLKRYDKSQRSPNSNVSVSVKTQAGASTDSTVSSD